MLHSVQTPQLSRKMRDSHAFGGFVTLTRIVGSYSCTVTNLLAQKGNFATRLASRSSSDIMSDCDSENRQFPTPKKNKIRGSAAVAQPATHYSFSFSFPVSNIFTACF